MTPHLHRPHLRPHGPQNSGDHGCRNRDAAHSPQQARGGGQILDTSKNGPGRNVSRCSPIASRLSTPTVDSRCFTLLPSPSPTCSTLLHVAPLAVSALLRVRAHPQPRDPSYLIVGACTSGDSIAQCTRHQDAASLPPPSSDRRTASTNGDRTKRGP